MLLNCKSCSSQCVRQCDWCKDWYCRTHYNQHESNRNVIPLTPQPNSPFTPTHFPSDINPQRPFVGDPWRPHPDTNPNRFRYGDKLRRMCTN